jgi:hypothetical protein
MTAQKVKIIEDNRKWLENNWLRTANNNLAPNRDSKKKNEFNSTVVEAREFINKFSKSTLLK